eukprot:469579-Hanusia_phi.AAC.1
MTMLSARIQKSSRLFKLQGAGSIRSAAEHHRQAAASSSSHAGKHPPISKHLLLTVLPSSSCSLRRAHIFSQPLPCRDLPLL